MLSPEFTMQLTAVLQRMRADLMEHVHAHGDAPEQDGPPQIAPGAHMTESDDAAGAEMISHDEAALVGRDAAEIAAIDRQLGRLELGEADVCIVCGETIPAERLLANPVADTCIRDQRELESRAHLANPDAEPTM